MLKFGLPGDVVESRTCLLRALGRPEESLLNRPFPDGPPPGPQLRGQRWRIALRRCDCKDFPPRSAAAEKKRTQLVHVQPGLIGRRLPLPETIRARGESASARDSPCDPRRGRLSWTRLHPSVGLAMETSASLLERLRTAPDGADWRRLDALYRPLIRRWEADGSAGLTHDAGPSTPEV